jgi:hypothetical protein
MEGVQLKQGLTCRNPEVDDDVTLQSVGSWLATIDVLESLGRDTKLLKDVMEHLSKTSVAQTVDEKLNCRWHLQFGP